MGPEQSGRRPALIVAGTDYLATVDTLATLVPVTSVDRGWPNHIPIAGGTPTETRQWWAVCRSRTCFQTSPTPGR